MRFLLVFCAVSAAASAAPRAVIERHVLSVTLDPAAHTLDAVDTLEMSGAGVSEIDLKLNKNFEVRSVLFGRVAARFEFADGNLHVRFPTESLAQFTVTVAYRGTVFDPPKRDEVRFVVGEKSSGTIQPEGAYLPPGCGWYPDIPGTMARFTVTGSVPEDWEFVGQGGRFDYDAKTRRCTWACGMTVDGLTCVAGPYVAAETRAGRITVRSYFFKEDAATGDEYRRAAVDWIKHFSETLAPYPFDDFSVVENFYSTGYGMPSYTLLGRDVVRMGARYLGEGGLGHEILHCWWGNSVFIEGGNWCEALTTYGSNYHWVELQKGPEEARKYRRHQMVRYTMHVDPAADYPVRKFENKTTEIDNEIGYGKGSMLFHLVRRRIGDKPFWAALRRVIREKTGARASWDDFREAFEKESGEKLDALFAASLDQPGAPDMKLEKSEKGLRLSVAGPVTSLRVRVRSWRPDGPVEEDIDVVDGLAEWQPAEGTTRVEVDPGYDVFRRLPPQSLPHCLNAVVVAKRHAVVLPQGEAGAPYVELVSRLQDWQKIAAEEATPEALKGKSLLVLGGPDVNPLVKRWVDAGHLKYGAVEITQTGWTVAGDTAKLGENRALMVSVVNPDDPTQRATIFFPATLEAAKPARLLLYYAWESWFVWKDGAIAARGEFPVEEPLAVDLP